MSESTSAKDTVILTVGLASRISNGVDLDVSVCAASRDVQRASIAGRRNPGGEAGLWSVDCKANCREAEVIYYCSVRNADHSGKADGNAD